MDNPSSNIGRLFVKGASAAFVANGAGVLCMFAVYVLLSRILGAVEYGSFVYVVGWISVLAVVGRFGMDMALVRFVPCYVDEQNWGYLAGLLRSSTFIPLGASIFLGIALAVTTSVLNGLKANMRDMLLIGAIVLPVIVQIQIEQGKLRGLKRSARAQLPERVVRSLILTLLLGLTYYGDYLHGGASLTMVLYFVASVITFGIALVWVRNYSPLTGRKIAPRYRVPSWLRVSVPLFFISSMHIVYAQSDIIMLGILRDTTQAGIYHAASRIAYFIVFGLTASNVIMGPIIASLYGQKRQLELQRTLRVAALAVQLYSVPVTMIILTLGGWILSIFGRSFIIGNRALIILGVGYFFNVLSGPVSLLGSMTGYERQTAMLHLASVIGNLTLNMVLIPPFGIEGAAIATATTTIFWNFSLLFYLSKQLRLNPTIFSLMKRSND